MKTEATTHVTAPTEFVEADRIRYAHRRFGEASGTPLIFLPHFRGGLDHWDPLVTDGLAAGRPVILFDNAGVASSSGETPDTIEAMGEHAAAFIEAMGPHPATPRPRRHLPAQTRSESSKALIPTIQRQVGRGR
jgi:hypothetical protein